MQQARLEGRVTGHPWGAAIPKRGALKVGQLVPLLIGADIPPPTDWVAALERHEAGEEGETPEGWVQ